MGANQSLPIRKKRIEKGRFGNCVFVTAAMQGWRPSMEDRYSNEVDVKNSTLFFSVYDGHAGSTTAQQLSEQLHHMVKQTPQYKHGDIPGACTDGFVEMDSQLNSDQRLSDDISGSTGIMLILDGDNHFYAASVGDSKCIISCQGLAQELSYDHLPTNPDEYLRIKKAGGFVNHDRVNGSLAMSRAFGDFIFKQNEELSSIQQAVTCKPEVHHRDLNNQHDEFMVLASDGVWEVLTPQQVVDFIRTRVARKQSLQSIAMDLLDTCITDDVMNEEGIGCDNITCTIVAICDNVNTDRTSPIKKQHMVKKKSKQSPDNGLDLNLDPSVISRLADKCGRAKLAPSQLPHLLLYQDP